MKIKSFDITYAVQEGFNDFHKGCRYKINSTYHKTKLVVPLRKKILRKIKHTAMIPIRGFYNMLELLR